MDLWETLDGEGQEIFFQDNIGDWFMSVYIFDVHFYVHFVTLADSLILLIILSIVLE